MWRDGRNSLAHRLAWEDAYRACILPGYVVMHTCDTPACINPAHLQVATYAENNADRAYKGRSRALRGGANVRGKLASNDVRLVREWYAMGITQCALAHWFGVSQSRLSRRLRGGT